MQERIEDDYSDFMVISEAEVNEFIIPAAAYIDYIEGLVHQYFRNSL